MEDRWVWDLNGGGEFRVKDVRTLLDETFLLKADIPTRWIKTIPIKVNIFAWKASLDRLPTRYNLDRRGVEVSSLSCPICNSTHEDTDHLLFRCGLATDVMRLVCRWWNVLWIPVNSYQEWIAWFKSLRMSSSSKGVLEGVFYTAWRAEMKSLDAPLLLQTWFTDEEPPRQITAKAKNDPWNPAPGPLCSSPLCKETSRSTMKDMQKEATAFEMPKLL
ncbi:RNA-directed DNA polymerase, eukaryota [Tanacetum coccineum]